MSLKKLIEAIAKGNLQRVLELCRADPGLTAKRDGSDNTALVKAVQYARPPSYEDPIKKALLPRRLDIVRALIAAGADVNLPRPGDGRTPMFVAAEDHALTDLLLEHGAAIDVQDKNGLTPMHVAASTGGVKVIQRMAAAGAKFGIAGSTPLHHAARAGNLDTLRALLDAGASPDSPDEDGNTPLHLTWSPDVVDRLVSAGAAIDAQNQQGDTALHLSAKKPAEVGKSLLRNRADPGLANCRGLCPLHLAAQKADDTDLLRAFVERGASLDILDSKGQTPLIHAIRQRNSEAATFLIQAGANLQAGSSGHVAADWAAKHGLEAVASRLAERGEAPRSVPTVEEPVDKIQKIVFKVYRAAYRQDPAENALVKSSDPQMVTFSSALLGRFPIEPDLFHDTELTLREVIDAILRGHE